MRPVDLANDLRIDPKSLRRWLRKAYPRSSGEEGTDWHLTAAQAANAREYFRGRVSGVASDGPTVPLGHQTASVRRPATSRASSDEAYVIDLCDTILGERGARQHTFTWLVGDPNETGLCRRLPVDAYYPTHRLVVEYRERQHHEPVAFFDRRATISGMGRGEQRPRYDRRREEEIPAHDLRLVIVGCLQLRADRRSRLARDRQHDLPILAKLLGT